jgi:hypothetical protein
MQMDESLHEQKSPLGDLGVELRCNPQPPKGGYDSVQIINNETITI